MAQEQPFRLGILGSGKGSNAVAIIDACASGTIPAQAAIVISDIADAGILKNAHARGIDGRHIEPGKFRTKLDDAAEVAFIKALQDARVELVVLAGFMRILKGEFLRVFKDRVINIHPSLLPSFPGLEAWKQALDYGVKFTGVTVHFVDQGIDTGPIIAQETVPILQGHSAETLHKRIQEAEHRLYPLAISALARGDVQVKGAADHLEVAALTHVTRISVRLLWPSMFNCAHPAFTHEAEKEKIGFAATTVDNQPGHAGQRVRQEILAR